MLRRLTQSMIATRLVRTLDVSAASGLVLRDGSFQVVADDENSLYVFGPDGALRWHRPLDASSKVEGVAVDGEVVWLASDADGRLSAPVFV